ncbi:hypothetical protein ACGFI4_08450 [Micromonospora carbonacea]|uniref:hypothetical protein n=1 Tax=Micromonospora carbonacea TaxID=47853 RepID=UPI0037244E18
MIIASGQRVSAAFLRSIYGTDWDVWTPTITGGGSGVFSAGGRWRRIGEKTVIFAVNWTVTTAGTGTGSVSWTLPTAPSRARRWIFPGGHEIGTGKAGIYSTTFTGGTGTTVDRVRYGGATNLTGADMVINMLIQFSGIYEEA